MSGRPKILINAFFGGCFLLILCYLSLLIYDIADFVLVKPIPAAPAPVQIPPEAAFAPPIETGAVFNNILSTPANFSDDEKVKEFHTEPIYSMFASGKVTLNKPDSYARVILTDAFGNEYLVYEAQGPFDSGSFSFENTC